MPRRIIHANLGKSDQPERLSNTPTAHCSQTEQGCRRAESELHAYSVPEYSRSGSIALAQL